MKLKSLSSVFMGDRVIWIVYFLLCAISLVEVYSAASTLAYKSGSFWNPLIKQFSFLSIGTVLAIIIHKVPCRKFKVLPAILYPLSLLLLVATLGGQSTNGASRWIDFGLFSFQPSEIAKGAFILLEALVLSRLQREDGADPRAVKLIGAFFLPVFGFIVTENLSTAVILLAVVLCMMFIGRIPIKQICKYVGVLFVIATVIVCCSMVKSLITGQESGMLHRASTWGNRLTSHVDDADSIPDPMTYDLSKDAQRTHANIAIASCNYIGRGPGNSVERDFLSQAFSDFIFAIIVEELGVIGAVLTVFLYIILLFRAGRIANRCERNFPPFLMMGLTLLIVFQALVNMLVAVGLFPVTGQPLPLVSRGGTSTLITCIYFGMILSVSRYARQTKDAPKNLFSGSTESIIHEDDLQEATAQQNAPAADDAEAK